MRNFKRYSICMIACVIFMMGMVMTSNGAKEDDDDDDIKGLTLTVNASITADSGMGDMDVTTEDARFSIDSANFVGAGSSWKPGAIPRVMVVLSASEGYKFGTRITSNKLTIKGGGTCTGVKRLDSGYSLEVTLRLKPVSGTMGSIEEAFWITSPIGKAKWDQADNANAYQVRLYRGDTMVKAVDKTTTNTYDFYPYMTKVGTYYFKVRPIPRNADESNYLQTGEWQNSDELYIDRATVASEALQSQNGTTGAGPLNNSQGNHPSFGWQQNGTGWWYHEADGSYPINRWSYIDNKWYFFDMAGYMKIGWQKISNNYYYLTVNGDMMTGWFQDNKKWYYLGTDGAMQTGWVEVGGQWFYLYTDGVRATGWTNLNKNWYYFNLDTGAMTTNAVIDSYSVNADGVRIQ